MVRLSGRASLGREATGKNRAGSAISHRPTTHRRCEISLPPGMSKSARRGDICCMSSAAARFVESAPARSARLLADVDQIGGGGRDDRPSVVDRLAAALGRDLAEAIVTALSADALDRLDAALTPAFAEHLARVLAKELATAR